jgi:hypothetical protein
MIGIFSNPLKTLLASALAAGLSLPLAGCLKSESTEGDVFIEIETDVLSIIPPSGGEAGTIVTRTVEWWCYDGVAVADTMIESTRYAIVGGKLYIWEDGYCNADVALNGSSSTIIGTWTASGSALTATTPVPQPYREPGCYDDDGYEDDFAEIFQNASVTYTVTESKVKAKIAGTLCLAPLFAEGFTYDGYVEATSTGCASVTIKNLEENKTATISAKMQNNNFAIEFSHGSSKCTLTMPLMPDEQSVCTVEDQFDSFGMCMFGSGFFGEMEGLAKAQSGAPSARDFTSALRKSLPFSR